MSSSQSAVELNEIDNEKLPKRAKSQSKTSGVNKKSLSKLNQKKSSLGKQRSSSRQAVVRNGRKSKDNLRKSRQTKQTSKISLSSVSPKISGQSRGRSVGCCPCLDGDDSDYEIKKTSTNTKPTKAKGQRKELSKKDIRALEKVQEKIMAAKEIQRNAKAQKAAEVVESTKTIEAIVERRQVENNEKAEDGTEDNPPAETDITNGNQNEGSEANPSMTSGDQLPLTETEETIPEQLRKDNKRQFESIEKKQELSQQIEKRKTLTESNELEEPFSTNEDVVIYQQQTKRRNDLIPFFLRKQPKNEGKMNRHILDNWFRAVDDSENIPTHTNTLYDDKDLSGLLDDVDELTVLFKAINSLYKDLSSKEQKLHFELSNMKDVRKQLRELEQVSSLGRIMSDISNLKQSSMTIKDQPSKMSKTSSRWMRPKSAIEIIHNFSKKWKDTSQNDEQLSVREISKTPLIATEASESSDQDIEPTAPVKKGNPCWVIARDSMKSSEFTSKRNDMREAFLKTLEEHIEYPGPTFGKYRMPIANFRIPIPLPNSSSVGSFQLQELYKQHFASLASNTETRYFPPLKFINANHISIAVNKETEGIALLGVGERAVVAGGYLQNSEIGSFETFIDQSNSGVINSLVGQCNSEGHVAVAIKIYRTGIPRASAVDFLKEAVMLNYVSKSVKAASPQYLGIVNLNPNSSFLSFGLVTLLIGEPETFEVVTLDRLLWQEIQSRSEHKIELDNWRWIKLLLNLAKVIHRLHRKLIIVNNLKMNSIVMRYVQGKGWTSPKLTNFSKAYASGGVGECILNKKYTEYISHNKMFNEAKSFETDITALGCVIRDVNLSLGLGLDGIVEYIQPYTPAKEYWSTCEVIDALEGAMIEERNNPKQLFSVFNNQINKLNTINELQRKTENDITTIEGVFVESDRKDTVVKVENEKNLCPLCPFKLGFEIKYSDVLIISQFLKADGHLLPRRATGLCEKAQRKLLLTVHKAQRAGLMPELRPDLKDGNLRTSVKRNYKWQKYYTYYDC
ncbi:DgyrCDS7676 [Dimorphilus gyrociliatus]|uniref:DgyrCDS7676 n=1 Tax=Dimorphilus gyrociliatus TaxID=2664684 RepID=A0A7I8VST0_9ANNE|nr:DgyrCDS7676 [Dimorphilus gyrociliatus]